MKVPDPRTRPSEYAALLVGALVALVRHVVDVDPGLEADIANAVAVVAPIVTFIVARRSRA